MLLARSAALWTAPHGGQLRLPQEVYSLVTAGRSGVHWPAPTPSVGAFIRRGHRAKCMRTAEGHLAVAWFNSTSWYLLFIAA